MDHILSVGQFEKDEILALCDRADAYAAAVGAGEVVKEAGGRVLTNLF